MVAVLGYVSGAQATAVFRFGLPKRPLGVLICCPCLESPGHPQQILQVVNTFLVDVFLTFALGKHLFQDKGLHDAALRSLAFPRPPKAQLRSTHLLEKLPRLSGSATEKGSKEDSKHVDLSKVN